VRGRAWLGHRPPTRRRYSRRKGSPDDRGVNLNSGDASNNKPFCRARQRDALASAHDRGHCEAAEDISPRKELIHAMSLNADRPINRAMVARRVISATRNYLKLHTENIKSFLEQPSCQDAKAVEAFRDARWRLSAPCRLLVRQLRVDALRVAAETPMALHPHRLALAPCFPSRPAPTRNPHSAHSTVGAPRAFVPWCISDAGLYGAGMGSSLPASEMLHMVGQENAQS
jgi:hypothetical protein